MFTLLGKLVGFGVDILKEIIVGLIKIATEHPVAVVALTVLIGSNVITYKVTQIYTDEAVTAALHKSYKTTIEDLNLEVAVANSDRERLNEKVATVEALSHDLAVKANTEITAKSKQLDAIKYSYQDLLKQASDLRPYTGTEPVKGSPGLSLEGGQVVCRRFPSAYATVVNQMVDQVNAVTEEITNAN